MNNSNVRTNNSTKLIYLGNRTSVDINKITCTCNDGEGNVKIYYACGSSEQSLKVSPEVFDKYLAPYIDNLNNKNNGK